MYLSFYAEFIPDDQENQLFRDNVKFIFDKCINSFSRFFGSLADFLSKS